ncbi:hypothetical protein [Microbulbifer sp. SAOS-129_SWC]|uniref:hypothetical protein n=1 Tax=Microbulbifer sp. SAOS-129_SWC TaxID=3145235 RepID=UPI003217DF8C
MSSAKGQTRGQFGALGHAMENDRDIDPHIMHCVGQTRDHTKLPYQVIETDHTHYQRFAEHE